MKNYIHSALQVIKIYILFLILAVLFILPFYSHIFIYSLVVFIIFAIALYSETSDIAKKEKRPFIEIKVFPWKGFLFGALSALPLIVIIFLVQIINFDPASLNSPSLKNINVAALKDMIRSGVLLPVYIIAKLLGKGILGYLLATLALPVLSGLGYLCGYLGFSVLEFLSVNFGINLQLKPKKKRK